MLSPETGSSPHARHNRTTLCVSSIIAVQVCVRGLQRQYCVTKCCRLFSTASHVFSARVYPYQRTLYEVLPSCWRFATSLLITYLLISTQYSPCYDGHVSMLMLSSRLSRKRQCLGAGMLFTRPHQQ